jgi:hypothetical protein
LAVDVPVGVFAVLTVPGLLDARDEDVVAARSIEVVAEEVAMDSISEVVETSSTELEVLISAVVIAELAVVMEEATIEVSAEVESSFVVVALIVTAVGSAAIPLEEV